MLCMSRCIFELNGKRKVKSAKSSNSLGWCNSRDPDTDDCFVRFENAVKNTHRIPTKAARYILFFVLLKQTPRLENNVCVCVSRECL